MTENVFTAALNKDALTYDREADADADADADAADANVPHVPLNPF